jgi:hypothetical protein
MNMYCYFWNVCRRYCDQWYSDSFKIVTEFIAVFVITDFLNQRIPIVQLLSRGVPRHCFDIKYWPLHTKTLETTRLDKRDRFKVIRWFVLYPFPSFSLSLSLSQKRSLRIDVVLEDIAVCAHIGYRSWYATDSHDHMCHHYLHWN